MSTRKVIEPISWPWYDAKRYSYCMGARKGNYLYLSGHTASEFDPQIKKMVFKQGIDNQDEVNYDKVKILMESAGGSMDDIVKETNYVVPAGADNFGATQKVRNKYYKDGSHPAGTAMVIDRLLRPAPLLEIECMAVLGKSPKKIINPGWKASTGTNFSPGVLKEDFLSVSGQTGIDHDKGTFAGNTLLAQAEQAYKNISMILGAAGASFKDVVKTTHYISPAAANDYQDAQKVRAKYFKNDYSAHSEVIACNNIPKEALITVDCTAIVGNAPKKMWDLGISRYKGQTIRPVVNKGKLVFLSTMISNDLASGNFVPGDVLAQMKQALINVEKCLKAAGLGWEDVLMAVDFIPPETKTLELYPQTANIRREFFKEALPPSTGVVQGKIIGHPEALVHLDFTAALD